MVLVVTMETYKEFTQYVIMHMSGISKSDMYESEKAICNRAVKLGFAAWSDNNTLMPIFGESDETD